TFHREVAVKLFHANVTLDEALLEAELQDAWRPAVPGAALVGADEDVLGLLVDEVELVARGLLARLGTRTLRAPRDRAEQRQRRGRGADARGRPPVTVVLAGSGLQLGPRT